MRKIVINGKNFIKKNKRGTQRYTCEIIKSLDKYVKNIDIELVVPNVTCELPNFKNIKIVKYGGEITLKGWQYTSFQWYCLKNNGIAVSLSADGAPIIKPGIVAIHDIRYAREKKKKKSLKAKIKNRYNLLINLLIIKNANKIITVSDFSRKEIINYYNYNKDIEIIYNGWEHLKNIKINEDNILKKYKNIVKKDFFFTLGGMEKNKNLKWIIKVAKRYPEKLFVLAGPPIDKTNVIDENITVENISNIIHLGYISDEEIGYFMKNCKAFIFPSLYEGFGIPPLEALYFGAKVICSNSTCLPEIYKDCVIYINPYDYEINLDKLINTKVEDSKCLFEIYSWENSAKSLLKLIYNLSNKDM